MVEVLTKAGWETAQRLVTTALGLRMRHRPSIAQPTHVGIRNWVARVELCDGAEAVATAVVKERFGDNGYDPADHSPGSLATRVAYESATLSFLARLDGRSRSPHLIGVDYDKGVLVMEDLGEGPGLLEHLHGDDPHAADRALGAYATALGELHAASAGRAQDFADLLEVFGARPASPPVWEDRQLAEFETSVETLGAPVSPPVRTRLRMATERMRNPGAFLALTHGDVCPGHDRIIEGRSMFIDWELGGFRHAFHDLASLYLPFPSCGFVGRLPERSVAQAASAYRAAAARGIPAVADDDRFTAEITQAQTYWIIRNVAGLVPGVIDDDSVWGNATCRQRLVQQVEGLADRTATLPHEASLAAWSAGFVHAMKRRWPETPPMPPFPAYLTRPDRHPVGRQACARRRNAVRDW